MHNKYLNLINNMELRHILSYLGVFLLISGLLSLLPLFVALHYNEDYISSLIGAVPSIVIGFFLARLPRERLDFGDAMILVSVSLIVISFFSSLSLLDVFGGSPAEMFVDSYFESVSGYTTTGFTVLPDEKLNVNSEFYNHDLIFRRSLMQWIGGLGIIVIFLSLLARGGISTVYLYKIGEGVKKITPSVEHTAKIMARVCLFYTISGFLLLYVTGMEPFFALNAAMSSISTGGFSYSGELHTNSLNETIIAILMLAGAVPFTLHFFLFGGNLKSFLKNIEIRTMLILLFTFIVLITIASEAHAIGRTAFNVISTITTTGYSLSTNGWLWLNDVEKLLFIFLMFVGAGAGSTGGGLKLIRFLILMKAISWNIKKASLPQTAVVPLKVERHSFSDDEIATVSLFFVLYILITMTGAIIISVFGIAPNGDNVKIIDAIFVSTSAISNASPSTIIIKAQPLLVKVVLIVEMITGRLEIFPLLALISYVARPRRKAVNKKEGR